ncbi:hypothetical protein GCM10010403_14410 [Glycomyces rutgersensis]
MARRNVGIARVPMQDDLGHHMVPDRMRYLERWDLPGTELYVDDEVGDGQLTSTGRGFPVIALLGHAGGVLHNVTWQAPAGVWTATERVQIKAKLAEVLANRDQFELGGMRFRPHVATDRLSGQPMVYVYRTDVHPEALVAVSGPAGLALTPEHRYLDVATLGQATKECLAGRAAP